MAFDTPGALATIAAWVDALSGIQAVYVGVPESVGSQVVAYVTVGGQDAPLRATGGFLRQRIRFVVTFAYHVAGAEATAEQTIAALIDALKRSVWDDPTLGGAVLSAEVDLAIADQPEYMDWAEQEFRRYPLVVSVEQAETINPSP